MRYSDKLDGYWEEGYHYYVEINNDDITVRDYSKRIILKTKLKYNAKQLNSGERAVLTLADTTLSRTYTGEPMTYITSLFYENRKLHMDTHYTIMGDNSYVLEKTEHDPFYNILIKDDEYLPRLQGVWVEWSPDGSRSSTIVIDGGNLSFRHNGHTLMERRVHAIAYRSSPDTVFLSDEDLTVGGVGMFSRLDVNPSTLSGYKMVCDASMPLSVFAREDEVDKIDVPPEAKRPMRLIMVREKPEAEDATSSGGAEND